MLKSNQLIALSIRTDGGKELRAGSRWSHLLCQVSLIVTILMRPTVRGAIHILRNRKAKTYSSNKYLSTAVLGTRVQTADTDI